jgi:hypothetical protein
MTPGESTQRERLLTALKDALDALELLRKLVDTADPNVRLELLRELVDTADRNVRLAEVAALAIDATEEG